MTHGHLPRDRRVARGVTLIELMVGMVIGLLAVVIITQVMANAEGQKRTTSSGSEAQVNGALALDALQRDLRSSGYGLVGNPLSLGCQIKGAFSGKATDDASWLLTPVRIVQGASGAPDTIRVLTSNVKSFSIPYLTAENHATASDKFVMRNDMTGGIADGDMLVAIPGDFDTNANPLVNWCSLFTATPAPDGSTIHHAIAASAPWNSATVFPAAGYPAGSIIINAGTMVNRVYSINDNQLERLEFSSKTGAFPAKGEPMYSQIVDLQAIYGKEKTPATRQGVVDTWEEAEPTTPVEWGRLVAVRVAVLARSGQAEKDDVTPTAPVWHPNGVDPVAFKMVGAPTDWKKYRYRVYESVVPLRNMLWQTKS